MKSKTFTRITKVLLLAVLFLFVGVRGWGQTILNFPLTSNNSPSTYTTGNSGCQILETAGGNVSYSGSNGAYVSGWDAGSGSKSWYTTSFNSLDLISLTVNFFYKSSATTGPRDFALQYSLNNSTWTTVTSLTFSSSIQQTPNIALPAVCSNQANLYLRLIMTSNTSIANGTINPATSTYLSAFVVSGQTPVTPSQSANIKFLAITPTTIKVACSPGNGTHRLIKINTSDSWNNPIDNTIPSLSNLTYSGSGEQTVYFGTSSSIIVIVPNSFTEYHFRVYEYNYYPNDAVTKFNTSTATDNPKQCLLESIINPNHSNIRLTTVTLGAEVTTNQSGTISERGVCWKLTPGVTTTDNVTLEPTNSSGVFTFPVEDLPRGKTIYYIGFVTNISGTSQTVESSFSNVPIFTGTGNWSDAPRWNVQEVPGANGNVTYGSVNDSPIIDGTCTLAADNSVTNLTINSGRILKINPTIGLTVNGTLDNIEGIEGLKLLSTLAGTGSLMHNTAGVEATIERFISGTYSLTDKKYHLVSYPFTGSTYKSLVWLDSYLFTYEENNDAWHAWDDPTTNDIRSDIGAMVYYPGFYGLNKTYTMTGTLNNSDYPAYVTKTGTNSGFNLAPNPFPSAIDWDAGEWTKNDIGETIYGFNSSTGTYGSYNLVGGGSNLVSNIIPVGQGFFVVATGSNPVLTIPASARLNNNEQVFLKSGQTISNSLHLTANANNGQDEVIVVFTDGGTDSSKDKYDAIKLYSELTVPQLSTHTTIDEAALSINTLPFTEAQTIVPVKLDLDYTGEVLFTASGIESFESRTDIKLEDRQLSKVIDLRSTPTYTFTHTTGDANDRFVLHFGSVLGVEDTESPLLSKVSVSNKTIYLNYPANSMKQTAVLYDIQGRLIKQIQLSNSGYDQISIASEGVYVLKINLSSNTETHKIVVR
jgi:hypothetical protein